MSKQYRIKWRESDLKELNRVVKNFNAKLSRLEKKNPENAKYLPKFSKVEVDEYGDKLITFTDRLSVNQLKELINTRQDFNREINALKRFSRRGAEKIIRIEKGIDDETKELVDLDNNIFITNWQKTEMSRRLSYINKKRDERREFIKNIDLKQSEKKLGYKFGAVGMGSQTLKELDPMNLYSRTMGQHDIKWKFRTILNESKSDYYTEKDYQLRDNYIKSLYENFRPQDINKVINRIETMEIDIFLRVFYEQGGNFEWSYPPNEQEYKGYLTQLKSIWGV